MNQDVTLAAPSDGAKQEQLTLHNRWGFFHCCRGTLGRPRTPSRVPPGTLVPPSLRRATECFLSPGREMEISRIFESTEERTLRRVWINPAGEPYRVKEISLCSQGQQPQTGLQVPGANTRMKLLRENKRGAIKQKRKIILNSDFVQRNTF